MKNRFIMKYLCITLIAAMISAGSVSVLAADAALSAADGGAAVPDATEAPAEPTPAVPEETTPTPGENPDVAPTPTPGENPDVAPTPTPGENPDVSPTPTPGENPDASPTPTPGENPDVSPTPTPGENPDVSPTPTPGENPDVSPTPTPDVSPTPTPDELPEAVRSVVEKIQALLEVKKLTLAHHQQVLKIRQEYDALTEEEKALVTNYEAFLKVEKRFTDYFAEQDKKEDPFTDGEDKKEFSDQSDAPVQTGAPVYYTDMVSNLHAGKDFYLDSLKQNYQLEFSDDFASVMEQIEAEYKAKNKLADASDLRESTVSTSMDTLLVRNWQDILAVYLYEESKEGKTGPYYMDASAKERLAEIFADMNPVVRDKNDITRVTYGNRHINDYIKANRIPKEDRELLKKYVETDCKLLCAIVTAAKGFVRESVGDDVSEERVNVIADAYSLVGEVGYFWGGKSTVIGWDSSWGQAAKVSASGSNSSGSIRAYGLDCSGFVTWAVINGYDSVGMQSAVGDGTTDQWLKAGAVSEQDAQPGDLVFQRGPEAGSDNHVGIICGKTDAGDWIAVHCSSSQNGVVVGEAYSAGFRYIRQPSFYPSQSEVEAMRSQQFTAGGTEEFISDDSIVQEVQVAVMEAIPDDFTAEEPENLSELAEEIIQVVPMEAME